MPSHNRSEAIKASKSRSKAKSARVIKAGQKQAPTTGARVVRKKR